MQIKLGTVEEVNKIGNISYLLKVYQPDIAKEILPGQFCNIKVSETSFPLLRRPFSICDVKGDSIYFMIDIIGEGTRILAGKKKGDKLDILGPLGRGFGLEGDYEKAVLVAGGIGLAPFPLVEKRLPGGKSCEVYYGTRNNDHLINFPFSNLQISSDDGSVGFHGNVIQLLESNINNLKSTKTKFFGCGPNPMLAALKVFCENNDFDCEISTESAMACGFGICQGCPIETTDEGYYQLICKDGPVFNISEVKI